MVLGVVFEELSCSIAHPCIAIQPVLNLLLGHIRSKTGSVTKAVFMSAKSTFVFVKEHVKPE
jgi:hypothetical protein